MMTYLAEPLVSKSKLSHSYANTVTFAMNGPRNRRNVWRPVPSPIDDATPSIIQYPYQPLLNTSSRIPYRFVIVSYRRSGVVGVGVTNVKLYCMIDRTIVG